MSLQKKHIATLLGYIGIGLIAGAISHGFFSLGRSMRTALIGIVLFVISEALMTTEKHPDYLKNTFVAVMFSIAIGMVSGGLQHFLDSPWRSAWIIPVGFVISLIILAYKDQQLFKAYRTYLIVGTLGISVVSVGIAYMIDQHGSMMNSGGHHGMMNNHMSSMGKKMAAHDMTVSSEFEFIAMMIPHHQEAVDTSLIVNQSTENSELKTLTQNIITAQKSEIEMMKGRLQQWYLNQQFTGEYHAMMRPLDPVVGQERDTVWTQDMIRHHKGAIQMAQSALKLDLRPEVKNFAEKVIADQSKEIQQMEMMLQGHDHH